MTLRRGPDETAPQVFAALRPVLSVERWREDPGSAPAVEVAGRRFAETMAARSSLEVSSVIAGAGTILETSRADESRDRCADAWGRRLADGRPRGVPPFDIRGDSLCGAYSVRMVFDTLGRSRTTREIADALSAVDTAVLGLACARDGVDHFGLGLALLHFGITTARKEQLPPGPADVLAKHTLGTPAIVGLGSITDPGCILSSADLNELGVKASSWHAVVVDGVDAGGSDPLLLGRDINLRLFCFPLSMLRVVGKFNKQDALNDVAAQVCIQPTFVSTEGYP